MKELPKFRREGRRTVEGLLTQVFTHPNEPDVSYFRGLVEYPDGHYAAVFSLGYFVDTDVPSKSQWNSLKKKLRRHDRRIFVFKEQQIVLCGNFDAAVRCGQMEFGFFAEDR